jgi:hypothetical protein
MISITTMLKSRDSVLDCQRPRKPKMLLKKYVGGGWYVPDKGNVIARG